MGKDKYNGTAKSDHLTYEFISEVSKGKITKIGCIPFFHSMLLKSLLSPFWVGVKQKQFSGKCNFGIHP
jgi:hypothetical protein